MLAKGKAVKVSIYVTDGATHRGEPVHLSILEFLFKSGVSGATALKGVAGFGSDHHLHTSASFFLADNMPLKIEFIETLERAQELLPSLEEMCVTGMIEMQETTIIKVAGLPPGTVKNR
jgi:PII-like signaling protein